MFKTTIMIVLIISVTFVIVLPVHAAEAAYVAEATTINDLIENANTFDGMQVTVRGEAIGEVLQRGAYAWVNINDGTQAIGIWLKTIDAEKISSFGDYKHIGDTIQITGIFSRDCKEHGGDVDIHCASIVILTKGIVVTENLAPIKAYIGAALFCIAIIVAYIYFRVKKLDSK
ncbi:MAG: hypothetical protein WA125_08990 [Desulfosporosinus sp.]